LVFLLIFEIRLNSHIYKRIFVKVKKGVSYMINLMRKVPADTFSIPIIFSMIIYSKMPDLSRIRGPTEAFFSSSGTNYIIYLLVFASGTAVDLKKIGKLLKHQGALVIFKIVTATNFSFFLLSVFGLDGIWGISGLGSVSVMLSSNLAINLSILHDDSLCYNGHKEGDLTMKPQSYIVTLAGDDLERSIRFYLMRRG